MKLLVMSLLSVMIVSIRVNAQGCVAIRTIGGLNTMEHAGMMHNAHKVMDSSKWTFNIGYRYFNSYKHFNGTDEQTQRVIDGTEVRNFNRTFDLSLIRELNSRWSIGISVPYINNDRSSKYEHVSNLPTSPRYETNAMGIGDIRLTAYRWLIEPGGKGNLQAGLGIKLPTGNYQAEDQFHNTLTTTRVGPVDQSIQPGDGGFGITLELNGFRTLNRNWSLYGNAFYLINPRDNNGVSTTRGGVASASAIKYTSDVMSVPDQYLVRGGVNWSVKSFTASIGGRYECIPTFDLIGANTGFRRPGTVIAIEPGLNYQFKKCTLFAYVPFALFRERNQSYPDILKTLDTKTFSRGDAAFADYAVNIGMSFRF